MHCTVLVILPDDDATDWERFDGWALEGPAPSYERIDIPRLMDRELIGPARIGDNPHTYGDGGDWREGLHDSPAGLPHYTRFIDMRPGAAATKRRDGWSEAGERAPADAGRCLWAWAHS